MRWAIIAVVEELLYRGYCQRRLEDWGDASWERPCFFTFTHSQYLIPNVYNAALITSLLWRAIRFGAAFAWTRLLFPHDPHALKDIPMTPVWRGALLLAFGNGYSICK